MQLTGVHSAFYNIFASAGHHAVKFVNDGRALQHVQTRSTCLPCTHEIVHFTYWAISDEASHPASAIKLNHKPLAELD